LKKKKSKGVRFWALKIFIITLILTAGISVVTETLMDRMSIVAAAFLILFIMLLGVVFDIIGIAFATCDPTPFVSMASKKIKKAKSAIRLMQNADIVSNICGDVVGDICGIVSGAAGAAVAVKIAVQTAGTPEFVWTIVVSSVIAALTVAGKAAGKTIAIQNDKQIVCFVSYITMFFIRDGK
jgi:CBS domain containing-hemolysin-like protein